MFAFGRNTLFHVPESNSTRRKTVVGYRASTGQLERRRNMTAWNSATAATRDPSDCLVAELVAEFLG